MRDNYEDVRPWIGVDLDGTLAMALFPYQSNRIGEPVQRIFNMVVKWVEQGSRVKIFTARVCVTGQKSPYSGEVANAEYAEFQHNLIDDWCFEHFCMHFEVTSVKDFLMNELYDDRAWRVALNQGTIVGQDTMS